MPVDLLFWLGTLVMPLALAQTAGCLPACSARLDLGMMLFSPSLSLVTSPLIPLHLSQVNIFNLSAGWFMPDPSIPIISVLSAGLVLFAILALDDVTRRLLGWLPWCRPTRSRYRQLLQDHSRALATQVALPRLLESIAGQLEEVFQPVGLAIVLPKNGAGYSVVLSQGLLAAQPLWHKDARFEPQHALPVQLSRQNTPLTLPHEVNVPSEQERQEWLELQASGAHLLVPMHLRGTLVGWIVLGARRSETAYTRRDLDFLTVLADRSSVALENARLYGEMQRRATELAMLAMVSSAISSSLDLEQVLESIVESVVHVMGSDKSALFELSEDGTELSLRLGKGLSPSYVHNSRHLLVGDDQRAQAITLRRPFVVPDIRAEPRFGPMIEMAQREGYRSVIDVPLVGRTGTLGILSVYFADVYYPTDNELEVLTTFANQAAIAIENARLHTEVTRERDRAKQLYEQTDATLARRLEELTAIEEISRQLTSTLALNSVMNLLLERALQAAQAQRGVIALYQPEEHGLQLLAQEGYPGLERYRTELWPHHKGITGHVARTGVPALVPDVSQSADYFEAVASTRSQLSVPIIYEGSVIGVITLESDRVRAFNDEHLRFAELLAEHAAIGIHNAQLFRQATEGRDRLQAILNSTHDVVIVLDTDNHIILTNRRVRELFGQDVEEWIKRYSMLDLDQVLEHPRIRSLNLDASDLRSAVVEGQTHPRQITNIAFSFLDDNQQRYMEGTASPVLNNTGEVIGRVAILRDVTHQQEVEQFREDLTSMVIHNLQGPLAAMISSLEMLSESYQTDPDMTAELLRIAKSSGRKLYERIESLLLIRRLEEKELPLDLQILPLRRVAQPVLDEYGAMASMLGVELETKFEEGLPHVILDEEVIGRVFSNLLDNALKFTPKGGRILVRAAIVSGQEQDAVLCSITDTGAGIPDHAKEQIFEKFRRATSPGDGRRKGMGIGLHYCKVAVQAHGGRIWVESEEGKGSTFAFTLPIVDD